MAGVLDSVNQRTQLVGQNRLELLLFSLGGSQQYGINVFKVKEVLQCPYLNEIPKRHPVVRGVAHIRGGTIPIMDMRQATGSMPLDNISQCFVIITEYNGSTQGFLVKSVERIVNMNWGAIHPPPKGAGRDNYLTAVTQVDNKLVEIIDVEKILAEVSPLPEDVSPEVIEDSKGDTLVNKHVLIVDDSTIARKQIQKVVQSLGMTTTVRKDGREALDYLEGLIGEGKDPAHELLMIISDIEMPEMDGYTFTAEVRANPQLSNMHIILHTSLSGVFNEAMVKKVGANDFLAKFHPDELAKRVNSRVKEMTGKGIDEA
ncbi:chemotaxis protein CheV [Marinagarivorans cellulosilyticus]|uniref:Two-component system, chemotaxis family, chemotaxis protein CheV n=1 Tax=Marinagarivorans cellulosilyticus TaxID=2721545 RepID=A0AAN2BLQ2_9GAMM|nr:chemotaxis protein CheV [Marinagarivorans cellulosilyticus]BCD99256.1 two-component system, chemotaxis family, chemotaxis protein CheV [Marinagarivorans cellulosilyticus]